MKLDLGATDGSRDIESATKTHEQILDEQARQGMQPALAPYEPPPATADVDAAIAEGRAVVAERVEVLDAETIAARLRMLVAAEAEDEL